MYVDEISKKKTNRINIFYEEPLESHCNLYIFTLYEYIF